LAAGSHLLVVGHFSSCTSGYLAGATGSTD
jgi:hypothetical protein